MYFKGAHTRMPKRRRPNAEKRLVPNQNKTEQLETENSRDIVSIKTKFYKQGTEYQPNVHFFII